MESKSTREIYLEACSTIAKTLEADGFKYAKSKQKLTKKNGDTTLKLFFSSSMYNMKGRKVEIGLGICIYSKELKKWRSGQPQCKDYNTKWSDLVISPGVNQITNGKTSSYWNVADPSSRDSVIDSIIDTIRSAVAPLF